MSDDVEVKKQWKRRPPEWLKDEDFPAIPEELAKEFGMEQEEPLVLDKALIKLLIRRLNAMKILKFFYDKNDAFYIVQVAEALGFNIYTAQYNLRKLEEARVLKSRRFKNLDKITIYFYLPNSNRKAAEIILKQYLWHVSFRLGRYIPYNKIKEEELREDQRFIEKCKYFGLNVDEGIETVTKCPKIGSERKSNILYLWRKEPQGYIPPEEESEEEAIEVEIPEEVIPP